MLLAIFLCSLVDIVLFPLEFVNIVLKLTKGVVFEPHTLLTVHVQGKLFLIIVLVSDFSFNHVLLTFD